MDAIYKKYTNPKEFLQDFEIYPIVIDDRTTDRLIEIIENTKEIYLNIPLNEVLVDRETYYKLDLDKRQLAEEYAFNLLKEMNLNKLILHDTILSLPSTKKALLPIDHLVKDMYTTIKNKDMIYEIIVRDLVIMLVRGIKPYMHEKRLSNITSLLTDVYEARIINSKEEFDRYMEEYKRVEKFYKRLNEYIQLLSI